LSSASIEKPGLLNSPNSYYLSILLITKSIELLSSYVLNYDFLLSLLFSATALDLF